MGRGPTRSCGARMNGMPEAVAEMGGFPPFPIPSPIESNSIGGFVTLFFSCREDVG
jgi:hypothetical protein